MHWITNLVQHRILSGRCYITLATLKFLIIFSMFSSSWSDLANIYNSMPDMTTVGVYWSILDISKTKVICLVETNLDFEWAYTGLHRWEGCLRFSWLSNTSYWARQDCSTRRFSFTVCSCYLSFIPAAYGASLFTYLLLTLLSQALTSNIPWCVQDIVHTQCVCVCFICKLWMESLASWQPWSIRHGGHPMIFCLPVSIVRHH